MRPLSVAGIVLICLGAIFLIRGGSFTSRRDVLKVGDLKITADEHQSIPPWVGGLAIMAGIVLVTTSGRRQR